MSINLDHTITFNSSHKIAFISNELMFNNEMLEYLRSMDLIIFLDKAVKTQYTHILRK